MQANYHTHTYRCRHAGQWGDEEYVQAALAGGYRVLGFSDHTPWKYHSDYVSGNERMPMDALEDYIASVQALRAQYRGRLTMYLGLECEYFPDYLDWLREMHGRMDYLILGNHFYKTDEFGAPYFGVTTTAADIYRYLEMTLAGMATGLYRYLAHPELPVACYPVFDDVCRDLSRQLCRAAKELSLPLEYNLMGTFKRGRGYYTDTVGYPAAEFWRIAAEEGCTAIIGVDAHRPAMLSDTNDFFAAQKFLKSLGMPLLEQLPGLEAEDA